MAATEPLNRAQMRVRVSRAERQRQIAEATLKVVARYGAHGVTISRVASAVGLSRSALYKFFPDRDAMLEVALDLLMERVPKCIEQSPGRDVFEHLVDMAEKHAPIGRAEFEWSIRPWFQFITAGGESRMVSKLAECQLMVLRDFAALIEKGKREGSIKEDADGNLVAWGLMMWAWADDVARLAGLEQMEGPGTSTEIFRRVIADIGSPRHNEIYSDAIGAA